VSGDPGGETHIMAGDPAEAILSDLYASGARDFDTGAALRLMTAPATKPCRSAPPAPRPARPTSSASP
jgi:hypothetical protein